MFKAGFYETDITPYLGCSIPGYFNLRLGSGVKDKLYVKAAAIGEGAGTVILIAVDACFISAESCAAVCQRIEKFTGIPQNNIMVSANHTHTGGPAYAEELNGNDKALDALYIENMRAAAADCAIIAFQNMKPAYLKYISGNVPGISYIRNYIMKDGSIKTNPGRLNPDIVKPYGETDNELSILFIEDENHNPKGAVCSFACHQDCVDGTLYSGDYSSVVSKELKKVYGNDFINLFLLGTCGNINHFNVKVKEDKPDHYVMMGQKISKEFLSVIDRAQYIEGSVASLKQNIKFKQRIPDYKAIEEAEKDVSSIVIPEGVKLAADSPKEYFKYMMSKFLLDFAKKAAYYIDVPLQAVKLGTVMLYGFPGEVFVRFGNKIKKESPLKFNVIATLCNADTGYIPTEDCFTPTLYESLYGSARLPENAGAAITEKLLDMAKKIM